MTDDKINKIQKEDCTYFNLCVTDRDPGYDEVNYYTVKHFHQNVATRANFHLNQTELTKTLVNTHLVVYTASKNPSK